ncbi:hypothetical protein C8R46DRAFT_1199154 [Mycena filopes]|nr:hypothetical protein C8R46DRAFT_1199154 [Mycena filopes]
MASNPEESFLSFRHPQDPSDTFGLSSKPLKKETDGALEFLVEDVERKEGRRRRQIPMAVCESSWSHNFKSNYQYAFSKRRPSKTPLGDSPLMLREIPVRALSTLQLALAQVISSTRRRITLLCPGCIPSIHPTIQHIFPMSPSATATRNPMRRATWAPLTAYGSKVIEKWIISGPTPTPTVTPTRSTLNLVESPEPAAAAEWAPLTRDEALALMRSERYPRPRSAAHASPRYATRRTQPPFSQSCLRKHDAAHTPGHPRGPAPSSMDRKLNMPEVLDIIFDLVGRDPNDWVRRERGRTLAALARTCKTFQNPALDALWCTQNGLAPILQTFPDDLWDRTAPAKFKVKTFLALRRPVMLQDWQRPLLHLARIRRFRIDSFPTDQFSVDVCQALRTCCPLQQPMFPKLQEIHWFDWRAQSLPVFAMFLSPRLRRIGFVPDSMAQLSILPTLGLMYPNLTHLDLRGPRRHSFENVDIALPSVLGLLISLKNLQELLLPSADARIIEYLARLPALEELVVDEVLLTALTSGTPSHPRFPALQVLSLWSTTPDVAIMLVSALQSRALVLLNLVFDHVFPDAETTTRLLAAIAALGPAAHETITTLHIEDEWTEARPHANVPDEDEFDVYLVDGEALRVLFPFSNLVSITLKPYHGVDLDDALVADMARAWPLIEELQIVFGADTHEAPFALREITLRGLHALATHCPHLRVLEIYMDASTIPDFDTMPIQTSLTKLDVLCSPVVAPYAVGRFLRSMFPNLRILQSGCLQENSWTGSVRRWRNLADFLSQVGGSIPEGELEEEVDE